MHAFYAPGQVLWVIDGLAVVDSLALTLARRRDRGLVVDHHDVFVAVHCGLEFIECDA